MSLKVALAQSRHVTWLVVHDQHVPESWARRCISLSEYFVAELDGSPVGFLRFSWFWGTIPYMEMIQVLPEQRHSGIGRALVEQWETAMRDEGATLLMTSSVSDETEPQAWHEKNGFREAGRITFGRLQPTAEVFFIKDLHQLRLEA
jgi:ribosomal protein S18 acetylase RimI-like enzyme